MIRKCIYILAVATAIAIAGIILFVTGYQKAHGAIACPANKCVWVTKSVGELIKEQPGADNSTPWMIEDKNGAPMAWVNLFGLYSGGDGGQMPGGLICVSYGTISTVACLTPNGTLQLSDDNGKTQQTLTAKDIEWIHAHE
jgi:hypothetical protein